MKALYFKSSGWCDELKKSYEKGFYTPKSEKEFNALEKYASDPSDSNVNSLKEGKIKKQELEIVTLKLANADLLKKVESLESQNAELQKTTAKSTGSETITNGDEVKKKK